MRSNSNENIRRGLSTKRYVRIRDSNHPVEGMNEKFGDSYGFSQNEDKILEYKISHEDNHLKNVRESNLELDSNVKGFKVFLKGISKSISKKDVETSLSRLSRVLYLRLPYSNSKSKNLGYGIAVMEECKELVELANDEGIIQINDKWVQIIKFDRRKKKNPSNSTLLNLKGNLGSGESQTESLLRDPTTNLQESEKQKKINMATLNVTSLQEPRTKVAKKNHRIKPTSSIYYTTRTNADQNVRSINTKRIDNIRLNIRKRGNQSTSNYVLGGNQVDRDPQGMDNHLLRQANASREIPNNAYYSLDHVTARRIAPPPPEPQYLYFYGIEEDGSKKVQRNF